MWREIAEQLHIAKQHLVLSSHVASGDSSEGSTWSLGTMKAPTARVEPGGHTAGFPSRYYELSKAK